LEQKFGEQGISYNSISEALKEPTQQLATEIRNAIEFTKYFGAMLTHYGEMFLKNCLGCR
jgi:hypothetical protein